MNKQELVDQVSKTTGLSKADVDRALKGTLFSIATALAKGEKVTFVGFGTFERRQRKARTGVNPQDPSQRIKIPAKKAPAFSAGSELKSAVASGKSPKLTIEAKAGANKKKKKVTAVKGKAKKKKKRSR